MQREEQKETLKSEQSTTAGERRTKRSGETECKVTRARKPAEREGERTRGAQVSRSGKFISTITGARRMVYTRFGNERLALVRILEWRVFRKKL